MYRLWAKLTLGGIEFSVDCYDIKQARMIWDKLNASGFYMMSARP